MMNEHRKMQNGNEHDAPSSAAPAAATPVPPTRHSNRHSETRSAAAAKTDGRPVHDVNRIKQQIWQQYWQAAAGSGVVPWPLSSSSPPHHRSSPAMAPISEQDDDLEQATGPEPTNKQHLAPTETVPVGGGDDSDDDQSSQASVPADLIRYATSKSMELQNRRNQLRQRWCEISIVCFLLLGSCLGLGFVVARNSSAAESSSSSSSSVASSSSSSMSPPIRDQQQPPWTGAAVPSLADLYRAVDVYLQDSSPSTDAAQQYGYPIGRWNVSLLSNLTSVFDASRNPHAVSFNEPLYWQTTHVTSFVRMLAGARAFDQDISSWNMQRAHNLTEMLAGATLFDQSLCAWAGTLPVTATVHDMFAGTRCAVTAAPTVLQDNFGATSSWAESSFCQPC